MWSKAIAKFKKALGINSNDAMAYYDLGSAYASKGMFDEAIVEFKKAIAVNPNDAMAHNNLSAR